MSKPEPVALPFEGDVIADVCAEGERQSRTLKPPTPPVGIVWLSDCLAEPNLFEGPFPVVPRIAYEGRVTMLAAREKDGKSTIAAAAVAAVSRGTPFLGEPVNGGHHGIVLWVAAEGHMDDIAGNLRRFGANPALVAVWRPQEGDPLAGLKAAVKQVEPTIVVIDTFMSFIGPLRLDVNSASAMTPVMNDLSQIAQDTGAAIVMIHHARKAEGAGYRDSTAIGAGVDVILEMKTDPVDGDVRRVKARGRFDVDDFAYRLVRWPDPWSVVLVTGSVPLADRVVEFIAQHPDCSTRDVRRGVKGSSQDVSDTLRDLAEEGRIRDDGGPAGSRWNLLDGDPHRTATGTTLGHSDKGSGSTDPYRGAGTARSP